MAATSANPPIIRTRVARPRPHRFARFGEHVLRIVDAGGPMLMVGANLWIWLIGPALFG